MKMLKFICLALLLIVVLTGMCLAEDTDFDAEYSGKILLTDKSLDGKNLVLIKVDAQEKYAIMEVLDKQGLIVDDDVIEGKLFTILTRKVAILDITQDSKFIGMMKYKETSWDEIVYWWKYKTWPAPAR